jgi:hypothetical protein
MTELISELRAWAEDDIVPADLKELLVQAADALASAWVETGVGSKGALTVDPTDKAMVEASPGGPDYREPVTSWYTQLDQAKIGSRLVQQRGVGPFGPKTYTKGSYDLWYAEGGGSNVGMPSYSFSQGAYALEERT